VRGVGADTVLRLAVAGVALAADGEAHAGEGEEVALVGRVDEVTGADGDAVFKMEGDDARGVLGDAAGLLEAVAAQDGDARMPHPIVENGFGNVGLEAPEGGLFGAGAEGGLERGEAAVVGVDAAVEFEGETTDGGGVLKIFVVVDIGAAEALDAHAAEVLAGFGEDDGVAELGGLHGGDDAGAGAAVNADVGTRDSASGRRGRGSRNRRASRPSSSDFNRQAIYRFPARRAGTITGSASRVTSGCGRSTEFRIVK
jgi:hypothetical protein